MTLLDVPGVVAVGAFPCSRWAVGTGADGPHRDAAAFRARHHVGGQAVAAPLADGFLGRDIVLGFGIAEEFIQPTSAHQPSPLP